MISRSRLVDRGSMVDRGRFVGRGSMVDRGRFVDRGGMVDRCRLIGRGSFVSMCRLVLIILGLSRVLDISDISTVGIINLVGDSLCSAIGKGNRVGSRSGISIPVLSSLELSSRVVISYSIVEGIDSRLIVAWLFVGRSSMVARSRLVSIPWSIVSSSYSSKSKDGNDLHGCVVGLVFS